MLQSLSILIITE